MALVNQKERQLPFLKLLGKILTRFLTQTRKGSLSIDHNPLILLARLGRLERSTYGLEVGSGAKSIGRRE